MEITGNKPFVCRITEGCIHFNTIVDGVDIVEEGLSEELWQSFLVRLGRKPYFKLNKEVDRVHFIQEVVKLFGRYEMDDHDCECCGDYYEEWELEL